MQFNKFPRSRVGAVVAGATVLVTLGGVGGAAASGQIGSAPILDGGVRSVDIHDQAVTSSKLSDGVLGKFLHQLEADGPYPGSNAAPGRRQLDPAVGRRTPAPQGSRGCSATPGKRAVGGGFGQWDYGS